MDPTIMLAEGQTVAGIGTAMSTALTAIASDALTVIGTVAPVAVPVLGGILVIGIGIKVFKKVTGR